MIEDLPENKRTVKGTTGRIIGIFVLIIFVLSFPTSLLVGGAITLWLGGLYSFDQNTEIFVSWASIITLLAGVFLVIYLYLKHVGSHSMTFFENKIVYKSSEEELDKELQYSDITAAKVSGRNTVIYDKDGNSYTFYSEFFYNRSIDQAIFNKLLESDGPRSVYSTVFSLGYSEDLKKEFAQTLLKEEGFSFVEVKKVETNTYKVEANGRVLGTIFSRNNFTPEYNSTLKYHIALGSSPEPAYYIEGMHLDGRYNCLITEMKRGLDVGLVSSRLSIDPEQKKEMGSNFLEKKDAVGFNIMNKQGAIYGKRNMKRKYSGKIDLGMGNLATYEGTDGNESFMFELPGSKYNEIFIMILITTVFQLHRIKRNTTPSD